MKNNIHKNLLITFALGAVLSAISAHAQHPTASMLISNNPDYYSINTTEEYLYVEQSITSLSAKVRDAYHKYPKLKHTPAYNDSEIIAFMITGVPESAVADELSHNLMQLEVLGNLVRNMNEAYLPHDKTTKLQRVSRKEASQ